ncbi:MAG TPA: hypothetical protein PLD91_19505 [Spirochaetota bacterium]|nr:hypothetical protein [Spirochaetota bacterium]
MNIFIELNKYRPRAAITPEENFFTQSFKIILEHSPAVAKEIVSYISNNKVLPPYKFETQKVYGNSIIDLEITGKNHQKLLIEIKVEAEESSENQIQKYVNLQKGHVAVISKYDIDPEVTRNTDLYLGLFYWSTIHRILSKYISHNKSPKNNLVSQFISFMESKGMGSFVGINNKVKYSTWENFYEMFMRFRNILTETQDHLKKHHYEVVPIKEQYQYCDIYFNFYPKDKAKKLKRNKIIPSIGIFLYDEKIWGSDYQLDYKNDIYLFVEFWNTKESFKDNNFEELKRNVYFSKYPHQWIIESPLYSVIGAEINPDKQLKRINEFYTFALKILNNKIKTEMNI